MSQALTARDVPVHRHQHARQARSSRSRLLRPLLMLGGVAAVAIGAGYFWLHGGRYVSIDNAYIRADKLRPLHRRLRHHRRRPGQGRPAGQARATCCSGSTTASSSIALRLAPRPTSPRPR